MLGSRLFPGLSTSFLVRISTALPRPTTNHFVKVHIKMFDCYMVSQCELKLSHVEYILEEGVKSCNKGLGMS